MEKFLDRKEGIGGDYLWEEEEDAIPASNLRFGPIWVVRLEREREGERGARVGRGREEEERAARGRARAKG